MRPCISPRRQRWPPGDHPSDTHAINLPIPGIAFLSSITGWSMPAGLESSFRAWIRHGPAVPAGHHRSNPDHRPLYSNILCLQPLALQNLVVIFYNFRKHNPQRLLRICEKIGPFDPLGNRQGGDSG
jgi:hypothetical protein